MRPNTSAVRAAALLMTILAIALGAGTTVAATVEGFEITTLSASNSIGDASIRTPSYFTINPTEGTHELLLTTISTAGAHDVGPNQSGTNAASVSSVATFLGVTTASIKDGLVAGQEGSAFSLSLGVLAAGSIVSFSYDFLTNDFVPGGHNDFAFVTLTGQSNAVVADELLPAQFVTTGAGNPFGLETHYQTFTINIASTGSYTLGIGVMDGGTFDTSSALLVDNISVLAPVPEPSTIGLMVAGALSFVAMRRRLKK